MSMNKMWVLKYFWYSGLSAKVQLFLETEKRICCKIQHICHNSRFCGDYHGKKKVVPNVYLSNSHNCLIFQTNSIFMYSDVALVTF